jgi:ATP-dependent Clp protease ATP-binding subunit ClpC
MTSNVGTKEALLRGKGVGFVSDDKLKSDIINKSLKQKFRPEFINRIDSIVLFNKLTKENLDQIILLEINKLKERVKNINYDFDNSFVEKAKALILEDMDYDEGMGARPILRILQHRVENKLTYYIIDNNPPAGTVFNESILD